MLGFAGMEVKERRLMGVFGYFQLVIAKMIDPQSASKATRYSLKAVVLVAGSDSARDSQGHFLTILWLFHNSRGSR